MGLATARLGVSVAAAAEPAAQPAEERVFTQPTYSSPIALSADNRLLWSVNPRDDSVSIVRTDTQHGGAGRSRSATSRRAWRSTRTTSFAFVANAAGSSVTRHPAS